MRYNFQFGGTNFVAPSRMRELQREAEAEAKEQQKLIPPVSVMRVIPLSKVRKPNRRKRQENEAQEIFWHKQRVAKAARANKAAAAAQAA